MCTFWPCLLSYPFLSPKANPLRKDIHQRTAIDVTRTVETRLMLAEAAKHYTKYDKTSEEESDALALRPKKNNKKNRATEEAANEAKDEKIEVENATNKSGDKKSASGVSKKTQKTADKSSSKVVPSSPV